MIRDIQKLKEGPFDLLVIGGGINGSAIANLAADAGLRTALLEKGDFASGTSSKSTKLLHGGLRYLESFEFGLVHESLKERTIHFKSSPHLTKHLRFLIPIYKTDKRPFWMLKIGMFLYDFLSGKHLIQKHEILTAEEVLLKEPSLASKDLIGGVIYSDVQMNDARFCLENVLSAQEKGACVANYVEVKSIIKENGKAVGVIARDLKSGESIEIRASKIICAVGSWTNEFMRKEITKFPAKVRNTKGVHIVYKEKFSERAFLIPSHRDNRILFVIPWLNHSLIGTTDTDFTGSPD
ncbi:MAG: glycerol-3-phosphate dehydrogenase/oxidase, partial [Candidatus Omnitrophica bacterium]|nr:glycerol-3-phosphate dehydrogenase/oxidase [Candidatus Omnitrophota bacterium]